MKKTIRNDGILCAFPAVTCIILPLCLHAALQNYLRSFGGPAAGMAVYSLISVFYAALYGFMQYFFIECNNRYHLASGGRFFSASAVLQILSGSILRKGRMDFPDNSHGCYALWLSFYKISEARRFFIESGDGKREQKNFIPGIGRSYRGKNRRNRNPEL